MLVTLFTSEADAQGVRVDLQDFLALEAMLSEVVVSPQKMGQRGWSPATFQGDYRRKEHVEGVSCLVLDVDTAELPTMPAGLRWFAHRTFSGHWRLVLELTRPYRAEEHTALRRAVMAEYGIDERLGPSQAADPSRFYFGPCVPSPEIFEVRRGDGGPLDVDAWVDTTPDAATVETSAASTSERAEGPAVAPPSAAGSLLSDVAVDLEPVAKAAKEARGAKPESRATLSAIASGLFAPKPGERDNELHRAAACVAALLEPAPTEEYARGLGQLIVARMGDAALPEGGDFWLDKWMFSFKRALEGRLEREKRRVEMEKALFPAGQHPKSQHPKDETPSVQAGEADDGWKSQLIKKEVKGVVYLQPVGRNVELILRHDPRLSDLVWNSVEMQPVWRSGPLKDAPVDSLDTALSNWLVASEYNLNVGAMLCASNVYLVSRQRIFDPVKEWLEGLQWDGVHRCHRLIEHYFQVEKDQGNHRYMAMVSEKWLIGAAARGLRPGSQMDTTLLLADDGRGGLMKTTFARILGGPWYGTLDAHIDKDALQKVTGKWIVEFAEMATHRRTDKERIRGFLTDTVDRFRPPYGRVVQEFPRRCVFVATSNDETPITDAMGARRYWPVRISKQLLRDELEADREQLFAEAVAKYRAGEQWWFTGEEEAIAAEERGLMTETGAIAEAICEWVRQMPPDKRPETVSLQEFLAGKMMLMPQEVARVSKTVALDLRAMGFHRVRRNNLVVWLVPEKVRYFGMTKGEVLGRTT
jgi:predicted P-loop ATPase